MGLKGCKLKFCYVDESGTGDEPYAVMVGIVVDALRMRPTKTDWEHFLLGLQEFIGRPIEELHTRDFYAGNGPWRGIDGPQRARIIESVMAWLSGRKHSIVFSSADKGRFLSEFPKHEWYGDVSTLWRFLALHLALSLQKLHQQISKNKGNTVLIFDNEERERERYTDLVLNPPPWTDTYYNRGARQEALDQIIDAPYFADSRDVPLLQVADFVAYFLRRYVELQGGDAERYGGERDQIGGWARQAIERAIPRSAIYPKRSRCACADTFFTYAPACLRG